MSASRPGGHEAPPSECCGQFRDGEDQPGTAGHLAALPCITFEKPIPNNQWVFESENGCHVAAVNRNFIYCGAEVMTEMALEGLGVAILPCGCAQRFRDLIVERSDKLMFDGP